MQASRTMIASAAAAAIFSVIGLAYAESSASATGDAVPVERLARNDAPRRPTAGDDTAARPTGTLQPTDTPWAPAAPATGARDAGSTANEGSTSKSSVPLPAPVRVPIERPTKSARG